MIDQSQHAYCFDGEDYAELTGVLDDLAEARATVRFHKRLLPGRGLVISAVVDGVEYDGPTAAEALLSWARRKA